LRLLNCRYNFIEIITQLPPNLLDVRWGNTKYEITIPHHVLMDKYNTDIQYPPIEQRELPVPSILAWMHDNPYNIIKSAGKK